MSVSVICSALTLILESIFVPLPARVVITLYSPIPLLVLSIFFDPRLVIIFGWIIGQLIIVLLPIRQPVHRV